MTRVLAAAAALLTLITFAGVAGRSPAAADPRPPIPVGSEGYLRTVLAGDRVESIPVKMLGVYEDVTGPGYDLYLIELVGPLAEEVGVAAGMSGSPVFFDGRLVGALAYRFGSIPKRPVGGVTPIEDMLSANVSTGAGPKEIPRAGAGSGPAPQPIATPVSLGALHPAVREWLAPQLAEYGFVAVAGGARTGGAAIGGPLAPGMPVGLQLVGGDLSIAATGTVTHVDGDTVYAFGHPVLGSGEVEIPMTRAHVLHTLADMAGSVKLANVGETVGAFSEDRLTAGVGRLGHRARTIPMRVTVDGTSYGSRERRFDVAAQPGTSYLFAASALANTLVNDTGFDDAQTVTGTVRIGFDEGPELLRGLAFSGERAANAAFATAIEFQLLMTDLYRNRFAVPRVASIDVDLEVVPGRNEFRVREVLYDRGRVRPGQPLTVEVLLEARRGDTSRVPLGLRVPSDALPGTRWTLAVGDPAFLDRALGRADKRRLDSVTSLPEMIEVLNAQRAANVLAAVLIGDDRATVLGGRVLDGLPSTASELLAGRPGTGGEIARVRARAESVLPGPVSGGKAVPLAIVDGLEEDSPR